MHLFYLYLLIQVLRLQIKHKLIKTMAHNGWDGPLEAQLHEGGLKL